MRMNWNIMANALKATWKFLRKVVKTVLRFFNLLEPDVPYMVLSLSKMSVWMTLGLTIYVVVSGQGMTEIGAALLSNVGAVGNYAYRRKMQVNTRTGAYADMVTMGDPMENQMPTSDIPFEEEPMP
jgi:hypothetical protein